MTTGLVATTMTLDPLLIQSFPAPPTHIPPTPTSPNPPPSRPPSVPLPPLPGPSRILGQESFFISNTRRRASKLSLTSLDCHRSRPPSTLSQPLVNHPDDNEDVLLGVNMDLNGALSDADLDTDFPPASPFRTRRHRHHADDSISSIDMRDILAATAGSSDTEQDPHLILLPSPFLKSRTFPFPATRTSPPPRSTPSPDIATIISSTPRPSRSRVSSLSSAASIKNEIKRRASDGLHQKSKLKPRSSEPPLPVRPFFDRRSWIEHDEFGRPLPLLHSLLPVGDRNSVGTDEASHNGPQEAMKSPWDSRSEDKHDDVGSDSDSSIDIHTPLPFVLSI